MRISGWSSDVCSSDLGAIGDERVLQHGVEQGGEPAAFLWHHSATGRRQPAAAEPPVADPARPALQHKPPTADDELPESGRSSCRARRCQFVETTVVAGTSKKKQKTNTQPNH